MSSEPQKTAPLNSKRGMTLLEVLIVLSIIALISAVVGPRVISYFQRAKSSTAQLQIKEIETALEIFYLDTGRYPDESTGLIALIEEPPGLTGWNGPYLAKTEALQDPWGRPYIYSYPGKTKSFDIQSLGRDGRKGGNGEDADLIN